MRRREFIAGVACAAAWPIVAGAQQVDRVRRIGVLIGGEEGDPERQAGFAVFRKSLQDLGWTEGRNLRIDLRWAASDVSRARTYAAALVALNPDAIFGDNTFVIAELKQATRTLPIIFARVTDPILSGLVSSLPRPDGNITGFADREPSSLNKLAEIIKEIAPNVTRVGLFTDDPYYPSEPIARAASSIGLRPIIGSVRDPREIEDAIAALGKEPNTGLIITSNPFVLMHRRLIIDLAARHKLPTIYSVAIYVRDGGLISYGADRSDQYRGAARYVDRILKGEKPADLPVQAPTKYEMVINLKTAKALGLTIPETLLATADEVIQ
jgi:putative tryptophan/tyrosine transport system substrate-binding protein